MCCYVFEIIMEIDYIFACLNKPPPSPGNMDDFLQLGIHVGCGPLRSDLAVGARQFRMGICKQFILARGVL